MHAVCLKLMSLDLGSEERTLVRTVEGSYFPRQTDRQTDRQRGRETETERYREIQREPEREKVCVCVCVCVCVEHSVRALSELPLH